MDKKAQIKSKKRVQERGEVFTNEREVKAMCDLVSQECDRIDSRFLEPACGDGNFLVEIIARKLSVVTRQYGKSEVDWEKYSVLAMTSIYGVDIMSDNAEECRARLYAIWEKEYLKKCKNLANDDCKNAVRFILSHNILCGDALTMLDINGNPIIFSEWSLIGNNLKRRDFTLANLLETQSYYELPLFEDMEDIKLPKPVREFGLTHYRRVQDNA